MPEIPEELIQKILTGSKRTALGASVAQAVSKRFRSMHYLSSELLYDCIMLNLLSNEIITPTSADKIITDIRRNNKSFYTTVDSAFFAIEDRFEEYARETLGAEYQSVKSLGMRTTNYVVYVISKELSLSDELDTYSVYRVSLNYDELKKYSYLLNKNDSF